MHKIRRNLISKISQWHSQTDRKPLLIRGARQAGKTWAVEEWARLNKAQLISINFEEQPRFISLFDKDLDVNRIIDELSASFGVSLRHKNIVLFFDEIQKAPNAITALRYFYERSPEIAVIAAGSLVEFVLEESGLPVGRVESLFVFPISFTEFLDSMSKPGLSEFIQSYSLEDPKPIPQLIHEELLSLTKLYYRIGGMPKVLASYLSTRDMSKVSQEQALLLRGYVDDFRKYTKKADWPLLETIFLKMGEIAGGSQVKFSTIDAQSKSVQVRRALVALCHALVIHKILPTHTAKLPLAAHALDKRFKIAFLDIGLLHHQIGFDWRIVSADEDLTDVADGRFAEQFVAQEVISSRSGYDNYALHYWERPVAGSEAEVDFVVEYKNTPAPIEVKSGTKGTLRSLNLYFQELHPEVGFVLSQRNVSTLDGVIFLPLYLACKL